MKLNNKQKNDLGLKVLDKVSMLMEFWGEEEDSIPESLKDVDFKIIRSQLYKWMLNIPTNKRTSIFLMSDEDYDKWGKTQ